VLPALLVASCTASTSCSKVSAAAASACSLGSKSGTALPNITM
jgi:hypothetical protein